MTKEIIQLMYDLLPLPDALDNFIYEEAIATMRDLGIFIGILKKHGIEPVEVVPELEYVQLVLMDKILDLQNERFAELQRALVGVEKLC